MNPQHKDEHAKHASHSDHKPYIELLVSLVLSFIAMYFIMYAMADRWDHVYLNLSNVYMTGLMAGSMLPIMLVTMPGMFPNKKWNAALWIASVVVLALFWLLLRTEAGVRGPPVPASDDSAPLRRHPDGQGVCAHRPPRQETRRRDYRVPRAGDSRDEGAAGGEKLKTVRECNRFRGRALAQVE